MDQLQQSHIDVKRQLEQYMNDTREPQPAELDRPPVDEVPQSSSDKTQCCNMSHSWWRPIFSFKDTVLPHIGMQLCMCITIATLSALLERYEFIEGIEPTGHEVVGIVIGFLLGFRTEAASNRHHQGAAALDQMHHSVRALGHRLCAVVCCPDNTDDTQGSCWREQLWEELSLSGLPPDASGVTEWLEPSHWSEFDNEDPQQKLAWKVRFHMLRLAFLLFCSGCRDLQKGSSNAESFETEAEQSYDACKLSRAEKKQLRACNRYGSNRGLLRVQLVHGWLMELVDDCAQGHVVSARAADELFKLLDQFNEAYTTARNLSYTEPLPQYQHVYLLLVVAFCFTVPLALVETFGLFVVIPAAVSTPNELSFANTYATVIGHCVCILRIGPTSSPDGSAIWV
jgi:hypothetical protein